MREYQQQREREGEKNRDEGGPLRFYPRGIIAAQHG